MMKPFQVRILKSAARELARLDKTTAHRIAQRMSRLAEKMDEVKPEPLAGNLAGLYKLRVGDYRVIYEVLCIRIIRHTKSEA